MLGGEEDLREEEREGENGVREPPGSVSPAPRSDPARRRPQTLFSLPSSLFGFSCLPPALSRGPSLPPCPQDPGPCSRPRADPRPSFPGGSGSCGKEGRKMAAWIRLRLFPACLSPLRRLVFAWPVLLRPRSPRCSGVSSRCLPVSPRRIIPLSLSPFLQFPPSPSSIPPFAHPKADLRPCGPRSPHISLVLRPTFTSLLCLSPSRSPVLPSCCVLPHTLFHFHCCSFQHCTLNCDDRTCPTFQLHRANSVIQTRTL